MAYKKGQIKHGTVMDSHTEDYDTVEALYLPHSCNEWVIGGKGEAEQMIVDLKEAIHGLKQ